jgi:hypothetical protein
MNPARVYHVIFVEDDHATGQSAPWHSIAPSACTTNGPGQLGWARHLPHCQRDELDGLQFSVGHRLRYRQ